MAEIDVLVAHSQRVTLRVDEVFLKIDGDQDRAGREVDAMRLSPIPTADILWWTPPVLALTPLPGHALGTHGKPSTTTPAVWAGVGSAIRVLHSAPLPPWPGRGVDEIASELDEECAWIVENDVLPADLVERNRAIAQVALRPWTPVFTHGDLQVDHVFVDGNRVGGVLDWSEAGPGDAHYDLATLTLGHPDRLDDLIAGYGADIDRDVIRAWRSLRSLRGIRWLIEHGYDPFTTGYEVDVLRSAG